MGSAPDAHARRGHRAAVPDAADGSGYRDERGRPKGARASDLERGGRVPPEVGTRARRAAPPEIGPALPSRAMGEPRFGTVRGDPIGPVSSFDGTKLYLGEAGDGPTVVF